MKSRSLLPVLSICGALFISGVTSFAEMAAPPAKSSVPASAAKTPAPNYLGDFAGVSLLPPPPPELSAGEQAAELRAVKSAMAAATPEEKAAVHHEEDLTFSTYSEITGVTVTPAEYPVMAKFFTAVEANTKQATTAVKDTWKRPRPYVVDPTIQPEVRETTLSYPSGHATRGITYALVLAEIFPEKRAELVRFGYNVGWHRVIAGVHFPADIQMGRVLGMAIAARMLTNAAFQTDLQAVRSELAAKQVPVGK
jgi:acid phosphatase (class A)